jgi:hypothetical protein
VPVEDLAELLGRWRDADSVWTRSQVITESARRLSRLTPPERRVLAEALARQGAPHAAASLEDRTGGSLPPAQVQTVIDELLTLDPDRIDELSSALQASAAQGHTADSPPPHVPTGRPADLPPPPDLTSTDAQASAADLPPAPSPAPGPAPDKGLWPDETTMTDDGTTGASDDEGHTLDDGHTSDQVPAADRETHADDQEIHTDDDLEVWEEIDGRLHRVGAAVEPVAAADLGPLVEAIRTAASAAHRRRLLADLEGRSLTSDEVRALLDAVPDGWQRRRAACQLLELGALDQVPATVPLDRLSRASDRRFLAGSLLDAGLLRPMELRGRLPTGIARRLAARAHR